MAAPRRRRWLRVAIGTLVVLVTVGAGVRAWLLRNPEPHFRERHRGLAVVTTGPVERAGAILEQDVVVRDSSDLQVEFRLRWRADRAAGARSPLFLLLGGHMVGKESARLVEDPRDYLIVSLSYPFTGNERVNGLAVLGEVPAIRSAIWDTPPAVMLALDYLLALPEVDTTRVELVGASFGVPFAAVAGALDARVSRVWLVQGGADPYSLLYAGLTRDVPWPPARAVVASLANVLASGPRFAPERWLARITPRPVVLINTTDDERIPRASAEALHAAAREPRELVWLPGLHVQPNRPDVFRLLVDAVFSRMD